MYDFLVIVFFVITNHKICLWESNYVDDLYKKAFRLEVMNMKPSFLEFANRFSCQHLDRRHLCIIGVIAIRTNFDGTPCKEAVNWFAGLMPLEKSPWKSR